jgi:putative hydrolase of the HAD superfamily
MIKLTLVHKIVPKAKIRIQNNRGQPTTMSRFHVITLDLDNTLWDLDPVLWQAEDTIYALLQQRCPKVTERYDSNSLRNERIKFWQANAELKHQISLMRQRSLAHVIEACGYSATQASNISAEAFELFLTLRHQITLYDHALPLLKQLSQTYTLGALSNGNADLSRLGLDDFFQFHFSAEQLNASKPDPKIFHAAIEHSGVSAEQILHIGDHPKEDIAGAQATGMATIWFNNRGKSWPEGLAKADAEAQCLSDIPGLIAQLSQPK